MLAGNSAPPNVVSKRGQQMPLGNLVGAHEMMRLIRRLQTAE